MYGGLIDPTTGWQEWDTVAFTRLWQEFVDRWRERDDQMNLIARVVRGDWSVVDRNARPLSAKSPNVIHVGLEDTAAAASMVPSVRVHPSDPGETDSKQDAAQMERLGASYLRRAGGKLLYHKSSLSGGAFGFAAWMVTNDGDNGKEGSVPKWRNPNGCYPEPDADDINVAQRMFFARDLYLTQLAPEHRAKFVEHCAVNDYNMEYFTDHSVTMLEYTDQDRVTIGLAYDSSKVRRNHGWTPYMEGDSANWTSVIVEDYPNKAKMCRGIYGQWPSLDGEPRGQYDQVVPVLAAHMRLVAMALEHAAQSVYNELVVQDPIGDIPQGPDAVIEVGPQGKVYRLPPATVSFSFFEETNRLLDAVHVGARWPRNRTGEISQSQASGKFVQTSLGVQNAVIQTHHDVLDRMTTQALNVCFALDKAEGPKRTVAGVLRNQQFQIPFDRNDIDLKAEVQADYGIGYGLDAAQLAVVALQLHGAKLLAAQDVQENHPAITDVARTRARLLAEEVEAQMKAKMWMSVQAGEITEEQLADLYDEVARGSLFPDAFRKYIIKPKKARESEMIGSSMGGRMMPGPGPGGPQPPPAPNPMDVLAGLGGGPQAPETIGRLSVPLGGGGFAGSQIGG